MRCLTLFLALTAILSPALKADLLVNGNFEAGNTGFSSQFTYSPGSMGAQTTYDVTKHPNADNGGFLAIGDHTTGTGQMLVVNGETGFYFWEEVVNVVPNGNYTFTAWLNDLNNSSHETIAFDVGSTQVGTLGPTTAASCADNFYSAGTWCSYSFNFNDGNTNSLTVSLWDLDSDFAGNDFAIDDLSLTGAAPVSGVPEPASVLLLATVLAGAGGTIRRRLRQAG